QLTSANPKAFYAALNLPAFAAKATVAVRSAFNVEDTPNLSMAGHFASVTGVDPTKPDALVGALCDVWASSLAYDDIRRDVLVMEMVDAQHAGVAFTETNYEDDYINYVEGTAEALVSGEVEGDVAEVRKLRLFEKGDLEEGPGREDATAVDRVQILLRRVRDVFGESNWDIEWADNGVTCYLVQVRPITAGTRRNELFTIANHKEILPQLPSRYMVSVVESVADDLYDWYRNFDSSLPKHRPFIEVFKGRPYINLSLMTETVRALGLPTSLVTDNIGGDEGKTEGFRIVRAISKLPNLAQFGLSQLNAASSAEKTGKEITRRTHNLGESFNEVNQTMQWTYATLVREMFNLTQAMSLPLAQLRRSNKLTTMAAASRSISTQMFDDLLPLREYVKDKPALLESLQNGEIPDDGEFKRQWGLYMAKYGHRGIYESDIARPRYRENPAPLLSALTSDAGIAAPHVASEETLGRLGKQAKRLIEAREQLRHDAMRGFERIRTKMLELAEVAVERGQLPNRDAIWMLTAEEIALIDVDWHPEADFWAERKKEIEALAAYDMPDLLRRNDDLEQYNANVDPNIKRLGGMSLVAGEVNGKAWVLQEPSVDLPEGFEPENTVLVARSVDSGWIPTFMKVAAVVVETGGDLSHGSIILRELGIPSVTNARTATRVFNDGDDIRMDGASGNVYK
ncbi:MAG: PEP-utilizing enzyme, partial [Chloroflexota bacterium]